jgi:hypothetical protein
VSKEFVTFGRKLITPKIKRLIVGKMENPKESLLSGGVVEVKWPHFFTILAYIHVFLLFFLWLLVGLTFWKAVIVTFVSYILSRV